MLKNHASYMLMSLLAVMFLTSSSVFAAIDKNSLPASSYLKIDDTVVGVVKEVGGGGIHAGVIDRSLVGDNGAGKEIAGSRFEPFVIKFFYPSMDNGFMDWISSTWEGKFERKKGSIISSDYQHNVLREQKFTDALIVETIFPELNSANKEPGIFTVSLLPFSIIEASSANTKVSTSFNNKQKIWNSNDFKLEIDGLDCSKIRVIDSFSVKAGVKEEKVGMDIFTTNAPTRVKIPDLGITIPESTSDTWRKWADDFIIKNDKVKKNGRIILMDQSFKNEIGRVELQGLGIFHLTDLPVSSNSERIRAVKVELFCEQMRFIRKGGQTTAGAVIANPMADGKLGQTYTLDNDNPLKLTMTKLDYTTAGIAMGNTYYVPQANEKLLVQYFTLENPNATPRHVRFDSVRMIALHDAGANFESKGTWGNVLNKSILDTNLQPGQKIDAYTVTVVPAIGAITQLTVDPFDDSDNLIYKLRDAKGQPVTYNPVTALPAPIADPADKTGATALLEVPGIIGTSYPYQDFDITVEKYDFTTEVLNRDAPADGGRYQVFSLLVKNNNPMGTRIRFDTITSKLTTAEGEEMESGKALLYATNNRAVDITMKPGGDMRVRIFFLVPKGVAPKTLTLKEDSSRSYTFSVGELKTIGGGRRIE